MILKSKPNSVHSVFNPLIFLFESETKIDAQVTFSDGVNSITANLFFKQNKIDRYNAVIDASQIVAALLNNDVTSPDYQSIKYDVKYKGEILGSFVAIRAAAQIAEQQNLQYKGRLLTGFNQLSVWGDICDETQWPCDVSCFPATEENYLGIDLAPGKITRIPISCCVAKVEPTAETRCELRWSEYICSNHIGLSYTTVLLEIYLVNDEPISIEKYDILKFVEYGGVSVHITAEQWKTYTQEQVIEHTNQFINWFYLTCPVANNPILENNACLEGNYSVIGHGVDAFNFGNQTLITVK